MTKTVACIIARTNSTRLPQKVLRKVNNELTLIEYLIEKTKKALLVDEVYLCTSTDKSDQILASIAEKNGIKFYAGSLDSVIDRMLDVAKIEKADNVIRITGDNVFSDNVYLDIMIEKHMENNAEYTRTEKLPLGVTPEIISVQALKKCYSLMNPDESQYLMLYMFQPSVFKCLVLLPEENHVIENLTLTVDTPEDFKRTLEIIEKKNKILDFDEIIDILKKKNINHLEYSSTGIIKFPANLSIYFKSFITEMEIRISESTTYQVKEGYYKIIKNKQNNV